jgi:transposase
MKNKDQLHFWKAQRKSIQMLEALLVTRERLVKMKTQLEVPVNESNDFVDSAVAREVAKNCQKTLQALQGDIRRIEHCIDTLIRKDSTLLEQVNLITSVPGVGKITALNMIVATAEFTRIQNAKKFACYAGVAPFEHTSGSSIRGRTRVSPMANVTCKKLLHLAALSAIRCCDELRIYYRRKVESGKNKMSVINAVRNKLIGRIFACIKERRRYQKILKISLHEP